MSSYYVVKTSNRFFYFYRAETGGLMCRTLEQGRLSAEICLIKNARRYFNVTLNRETPLLFCQDSDGNLWLLTEHDGHWNSRALKLASDTSDPDGSDTASTTGIPKHDLLITPIPIDKGLCLIYNTISADGTGHYLVMRQTNESGGWLPAQRIDKFQPLNHLLYETQSTSLTNPHMLLFYQTRTAENQLGYREITPSRFGAYQRFHSATGAVADTAFLTTAEAVHVLYIVKTLFSCQLLYRKRTDAAFSTPILLWEAPRLDQCLLSFVYDNLYASCMIGGQLYIAVSENRGDTFSRMSLYKSKFCYDPVKAVYLSTLPSAENDLYVRQVYVDRNTPWDTQMIPDLYGEYYQFLDNGPENTDAPVPKDILRDMQDRLDSAARQLEERDRHIMQLMMEFKMRGKDE